MQACTQLHVRTLAPALSPCDCMRAFRHVTTIRMIQLSQYHGTRYKAGGNQRACAERACAERTDHDMYHLYHLYHRFPLDDLHLLWQIDC